MSAASRLGLGTAQWGLRYGIANATGRPTESAVAEMLTLAASAGIDTLDTAHAYGEAQAVLGRVRDWRKGFRIVTKTAVPRLDMDVRQATAEAIRGFADSLSALGDNTVYGLMAHRGAALLQPDSDVLWAALAAEKEAGRVEHIGVSVYAPEELEAILRRFIPDIVQVPCSIYDQRFLRTGTLDFLAERGIEVHVRSVLLQGLLAMPADSLPSHFSGIAAHHRRLHAALAAAGLTPIQAALRFCLDDARIARVIVGCETAAQLVEVIAAADASGDVGAIDYAAFALPDERIILPTLWPH